MLMKCQHQPPFPAGETDGGRLMCVVCGSRLDEAEHTGLGGWVSEGSGGGGRSMVVLLEEEGGAACTSTVISSFDAPDVFLSRTTRPWAVILSRISLAPAVSAILSESNGN